MARGLPSRRNEHDWDWERLSAWAPEGVLRRGLDLLALDKIELHAAGPHAAGRVGGFDVGLDLRTGKATCSCGVDPPCAHAAALAADACELDIARAPKNVQAARRPAFMPGDPATPVPAFPETSSDLEIPADSLSAVQRAAVETVAGVVRKSSASYTIPRDEADRLSGLLDAAGTGLVVYSRRPFVKFRASLAKSSGVAHLIATETPGLGVRSILERHGYRILRKPKSLVHEYEGPADSLHLLGEALGAQGTAVLLADRAPPSFEPLAHAAPPPAPRGRAPLMPVIFSRRRFDWWTPREGLAPLQLAIVQRHGAPAEKGYRLSGDGLRSAERELLAAGLHAQRVEEAPARNGQAEAGARDGETRIFLRIGEAGGIQALHANGFQRAAGAEGVTTMFEGPTANLPAAAVALAQSGVHLLPPADGWPTLPELPSTPLFADDPRVPLAREGVVELQSESRVALVLSPAGSTLPRVIRIELYRMGWLDVRGEVTAAVEDAGRLLSLLREAGFDAKWAKPAGSEWRLASVRYSDRPKKEGGGTLVHLKGPIPLGRLGGVDPGEEAERIAAMVHDMEAVLKRHHPDARPVAHGAMPGVWTVSGGSGRFLLDAAAKGASVTPAPQLNPIPLGRGVVLVDTTCLPPRLSEFRRAGAETQEKPVVSPEIENVVRRVVPEGIEVDDERGHYLIPSTRMNALILALREMGAKVLHRRLAPRGKRYARWEPVLPEDETGARPALRTPFRGIHEGKVKGLRPECKLDPHQREGLAFILHHEHSCLLADEMGLGKTLQAIAAAQFLAGRVLVVCPASARDVWKQEVLGWTTEKVRVLLPRDDPETFLSQDKGEKYVVLGYSGLAKFGDAVATIPFDLVILDESHYVKSRAAQRTKIVQERLQGIPRRLILSGTPVMNEPKEIRTQLAFVHPEEWSDSAWFNRRFQFPWKHGTPEVREKVLARLREYLDGVMLRREKRVALPDLPEKHLHVRRLQLPEEARRAYDEQEDEFRDYVQDNEETALAGNMATTAGRLERLKQTALIGKLPLIVEEIKKLLETDEKIVVFCHYREPIRALSQELAEYGVVTLTGSTAPDDRGAFVKRFQKDANVRVFVGQTLAAGVAVTLTAARHAVFCDLEWNPAVHRQAMDRIHRKTQTQQVEVHFFLADDTVEETIAEVLEEKTEMMDQLLEGRKGGTFGLRDKQAAQREVALRLLSRRRRLTAADLEDDED